MGNARILSPFFCPESLTVFSINARISSETLSSVLFLQTRIPTSTRTGWQISWGKVSRRRLPPDLRLLPPLGPCHCATKANRLPALRQKPRSRGSRKRRGNVRKLTNRLPPLQLRRPTPLNRAWSGSPSLGSRGLSRPS